jgi:hypothetical protein
MPYAENLQGGDARAGLKRRSQGRGCPHRLIRFRMEEGGGRRKEGGGRREEGGRREGGGREE